MERGSSILDGVITQCTIVLLRSDASTSIKAVGRHHAPAFSSTPIMTAYPENNC